MTIGSNVVLGVGFYNFTRKTAYPKSVNLLKESNEIVISKRTHLLGYYNDETNEYDFDKRLLPGDQRKSQTIGGEKITFTVEETSEMKSLMAPGIRLLGFKPQSKITVHQYFRPANFLYPDETTYAGSTQLFRALWEKCIEKKKVAICVLTTRRKVAPRYVALVPQENECNSDGFPNRQNGFRVVFLPCEVHIRNIDVFDKVPPQTKPEATKLFERIIKKLRFKYKPEQFENPAIKTMYANIEALAYDSIDEPDIEDTTLPDINRQDTVISQFLDEFNELFGQISMNPPTNSGAAAKAKRVGDGASGQPAAKVAKIDNIDATKMMEALEDGTVSKLTVNVLRSYLQGLNKTGLSKLNKTDLIELIREHHNL